MTKRKYAGPVLTSCDEQTAEWVKGNSYHSDHRGCGQECCPDFSCCNPALLQPLQVRQAFVAADEKTQNKMLMVFLGAMLGAMAAAPSVHITDGNPPEEN